MTQTPACDRSWQVEAARDARLTPSAGLAFSLHIAGCAACKAEQRALDRLAQALQQSALDIDDVALRRLRQQTLEKANAAVLQPRAGRPFFGRLQDPALRWRALGVAAAVCMVLGGSAWLGVHLHSLSAPKSAVLVLPHSDAKWRRNLDKHIEHVDLTSGTLLFRVARSPTDRRLIVRVPDGEIEDLGTTFSVTVQDGKTSEIIVREGRVLFHRRGASALQLVAGSSWTPPPEIARPAAHTRTPELGLAVEPNAPSASTEEPKSAESRALSSPPARRRVARQKPLAVVQATQRADEDAAYLHMLALLREGRAAEARLAAHAYLRTFPRGFRHAEVTRVADSRDVTRLVRAEDEPR